MMKAVMYGAGSIGRGFIGQLLSESGYEVVFIDINRAVVDELNKRHSYPIRVVSNDNVYETEIQNVRAVLGTDVQAAAKEIAEADIMATAVGANILPRIASVLAAGLALRFSRTEKPLNMIICENLLDANILLKKWIGEHLPEDQKELMQSRVGFVEASIGRMVPVMTPEMQEGDILRVWVEPYCDLPVDGSAFAGSLPVLKNMIPYSPFEFFIQRKLFIHNLGHAACAYHGFMKGYEYIWQAVGDEGIKGAALAAMKESAAALSGHFSVPLGEINAHIQDLIGRFGNKALGDTTARVGKDPLRKLSPNDRIIGSASLCRQEGLPYGHILKVLAAALRFDREEDGPSQKMRQLIKEQGLGHFLREWCALPDDMAAQAMEYYGE